MTLYFSGKPVSDKALLAYRKSVCGLDGDLSFGRRLSVISSGLNDCALNKDDVNVNKSSILELQNEKSLLSSPKFYLFMLHGFFTFAAFMLPTQFLPSQMASEGLSHSSASKAIGGLTVANLVGRLTGGLIMDHPKIGLNNAYIAAHFAAGIVILAFQFCRTEVRI